MRRATALAKRALSVGILILTVCVGAPAVAAPLCRDQAAAAPGRLDRLRDLMANGRTIAYQPTSLQVVAGHLTRADDASIREDLRVLRPSFDGLVTYGARNGAERIPDIAAELGFRAVVVGVWDPLDVEEVDNALAAAARQPRLVVGISLGNELIFGRRAGWGELRAALDRVRAQAPGLPLATTEPFAQFLDEVAAEPVLAAMDFMLVNVHPIFEGWFQQAGAANWAEFVVRVTGRLQQRFCGPILVKETGVPTGPVELGYTEERQRAFYRALEAALPAGRALAFAYFSAFDAPWRVHDVHPVPGSHPEEAFWGLFTADRRPKAVVAGLPALRRP